MLALMGLVMLGDCSEADAQTQTGSIIGVCTEAKGVHEAPLSGYFVTAKHYPEFWDAQRKQTVAVMSEKDARISVTRCRLDGQYSLLQLQPGKYWKVSVASPDGKMVRIYDSVEVLPGSTTRVDFRKLAPGETPQIKGIELPGTVTVISGQPVGMTVGERLIEEVLEFRTLTDMSSVPMDGSSLGLPSKDVPGMPRFDQCIITTNDDHLQPLVFLTGPVNVGLFVDRSQELLLPPGSYRIQAYANAPTNLADNRIADLAISDAFTLRPGWRVDLNFRIIQSNGAAEGLSEVQGVPATSPPIATALPKSIQYEIERIRNGPHAAMPLAEAAPSALDDSAF
jgi:hypothetical protein